MINLLNNDDSKLKNQIQFLLGKEVLLSNSEVNSLAHCTVGNLWIIKVLEKLGLTIDDIIYEQDRNVLKKELQNH